ncbi:MAG: hypothetical protein ACK53L_21630, partial [Pirellulaceae bacterium]
FILCLVAALVRCALSGRTDHADQGAETRLAFIEHRRVGLDTGERLHGREPERHKAAAATEGRPAVLGR